MPQPSQASSVAKTEVAVGATGTAAGVGTIAGTAAAVGAGLAGVGVAAAAILAAFIQWLSALRAQHQQWLSRELGRYAQAPNDVAAVVRREMLLEQAFARNSADRLASGLPQALAIVDRQDREAALRALLTAEERYAGQRAEAMAARAIAAVTRAGLRRSSPLGAFWQLGVAHQHTHGCEFMAGKFWPWAVLDRIYPPRHYGCTSSLHSYADAILNGWMTPSDVPDTRAAVRAAAGVVMEGQIAEALLLELDVRETLLESGVSEARLSGISFQGVS